jgi:hypothetical protein
VAKTAKDAEKAKADKERSVKIQKWGWQYYNNGWCCLEWWWRNRDFNWLQSQEPKYMPPID